MKKSMTKSSSRQHAPVRCTQEGVMSRKKINLKGWDADGCKANKPSSTKIQKHLFISFLCSSRFSGLFCYLCFFLSLHLWWSKCLANSVGIPEQFEHALPSFSSQTVWTYGQQGCPQMTFEYAWAHKRAFVLEKKKSHWIGGSTFCSTCPGISPRCMWCHSMGRHLRSWLTWVLSWAKHYKQSTFYVNET